MRLRALFVGLALVVAASAGDRALACGDHFLNLGLSTRYERSPAARQAAGILMYASDGSELSRAMTSLAIEASLRKQGYRPTTVASAGEFDAALRSRKWDVVVVDGKESHAVSQRVTGTTAPQVVPVLMKPTKDELKQARQVYRTVIDTPTKSRTFLDTIEDAMDLHEDAIRAAAKKGSR